MPKFILTGNQVYKNCKFCNHRTTSSCLPKHEEHCYLNPKNKKLCPICKTPIKNYKTNITCSTGCANTHFRSGINNPNWKSVEDYSKMDASIPEKGPSKICFTYHPKKCVICSEFRIVEVHHYDGDRNNNHENNLIPLCPTHHRYWHSKYKYLIKDQIDTYVMTFINQQKDV